MGKKQYQSQGRYARTGSQAKKKRSNVQRSVNSVSSEQDMSEGAAPSVPATPRASTPAVTTPHTYVISDMVHTLIIAVIAFVILAVLSFVL